MDSTFHVGEFADFHAIGSGGYVARGSLWTTKQDQCSGLKGEDRTHLALCAAAAITPFVRPPFSIKLLREDNVIFDFSDKE